MIRSTRWSASTGATSVRERRRKSWRRCAALATTCAGSGDSTRGKELYIKHCAVCHTLHGEGNKVGPDLTTANRKDRAALLANLVDPSAVIRREFLNYAVQTSSGQILTGLLAEQDAGGITILDAKNQRIKLPRDQVESIGESNVSLMPEKILDALSPQELRDLFGYLEK